ncbi:MAG: F0F1 ATP synthase subunit A [Clostridia bacterium]|nr:F0F1 ATP synthase subunit A [Clostridia bacterium]MBQ2389051.1 F0F1 ATP synthase subunit A [Clostridia bacterium]MBQ5717103.1 F0F1 ATP synthase subunit A [Clostridia bacterium]
MNKTSRKFKILDAFYIAMMILPIIFGIVLQVLTKPLSEGIAITGARVYFTIPMPVQDFPVTESQVNSAIVLVVIFFFCLYITHGMSKKIELKRQHLAELIVEKVDSLVKENMGEYFMGFAPFIIAIMALSAFSSLLTLFGLYPPTSDINIVGGWAALVFFLITYYKMKCGPINYLKGFAEPVALLAPINFISEFATPISMAFRHYGNVLSGSVISVLLGSALAGLSSMILGNLPGFLADVPLFQMGIPAVLSIYFDVFSGCLQAFIFAMLTMMYVGGAFDIETYKQKKARKSAKNKQ